MLFWMMITWAGCGGMQHPGRDGDSNALETVSWPRPALLTATEQQTEPGLSVVYAACKIRHIDKMPGRKWMTEKGVPGEPIRIIANKFGNGEVFGSGKSQLVCVQMQGYLNFEETGNYLIKANSNDGIRVFLDNKIILDDPVDHADRFTSDGRDRDQTSGPISHPGAVFSEKGNGNPGNVLENTRSRQV